MSGDEHRLRVILFGLVFVTYAYFYQAGGANQNSRFDLTLALVENHSVTIDPYHWNTSDKACRGPRGRCTTLPPAADEHMYCDKAPGVSWLAAPIYALVSAVTPDSQKDEAYLVTASYLMVLFAVALPSALATVALHALLTTIGLGVRAALAVSLAYALATPAFPYSTLLYGHQSAAAALLFVMAILVRVRLAPGSLPSQPTAAQLLGCGVLLGSAVAIEYPVALVVTAIGLYMAAWVRPLHRLAWAVAGIAAVGGIVAIYHTRAFGSPWALGYDFSTKPDRSSGAYMGISFPSLIAIVQLLFLPWRGLFYSAPWLLFALPGLRVMLRSTTLRPEGLLCLFVSLSLLWLNASLVDWAGGYTFGARYLIPALPFLALAVGAWLREVDARQSSLGLKHVLLCALGVVSGLLMLVATAVRPEVPVEHHAPFGDFLLPRFLAGELAVNTQSIYTAEGAPGGPRAAWNLGQFLNLDGLASLVPLAAVSLVCCVWMYRLSRPTQTT